MSVQNSIRTTFEQKIAEIKSRLEAKLRDVYQIAKTLSLM
jgi:hypothetical protein